MHILWCFVFFFPSQLCCPLRFQNSSQIWRWEGFLLCGNLSFTIPSPGWVSVVPNSFASLSFINCATSFGREWAAFLGAWCPLPALRSCFVEVAQRSNDLLMNLWERKWSPRPIPWPSWDCLHYSFIINSSGYFNIFCFSCDFQKYYYGRLRCNFLSFCLNWNFNLDQCFSLVLESSKLFCFLILLLSHFLCFSLWYSSYELLDHFTISHLSTVFFLYFSILLYN